ncbi:MAG: amino acid permease [Lachnospiraceae bacterium]|nr:amino acid permease [Lachnospiraceae bacterium]
MTSEDKATGWGLRPYLSRIEVWALSFGCAVGWGAFVMPGTTFLPKAGPLGTILGMMIGAMVMFVIGMNYHYLMNRFPDAGGTLTYTVRSFGYDHGFLSSWFLILVYVAIIWANASALGLISRNLLGSTFQFGFYYQVLGYDVYLGEVLLSAAAILICGMLLIIKKRAATIIQVVFALLLLSGVIVVAVAAYGFGASSAAAFSPAFSVSSSSGAVRQVFTIAALSPWAFVGFESISNSTKGFRFPIKDTKWLIAVSILAGGMAYILLTRIAVSVQPDGFTDWSSYIAALDSQEGLAGLPVFFAADRLLGRTGVVILGLAALAGIITGLIGNFVAGSRLLYTMAQDGILPQWFGVLNAEANPRNALIFLMAVSVLVPFLGRTAIGWIVDVTTVGATLAYAYTSAAAYTTAKKEGNRRIRITGLAGIVMSGIFFLYFMSWSAGALSTESYLILASWSILGFVYFRFVFAHDTERKFGKSTVTWLCLLFLIFFTSLMWVKQATDDMTKDVVENISEYYEEQNTGRDPETIKKTEEYLAGQMKIADRVLTRNSLIQMLLIMASLGIMLSIYSTVSRREKQMETEKIKAEEGSRAKSAFLSNMSHDIRTPMNAIIGYANLADREDVTFDEMKMYLDRIRGTGNHLLALINDILEMSRIESGRMQLDPSPSDLCRIMGDTRELFETQMSEKDIDFSVDLTEIKNGKVYCDRILLNRVMLNLVGNAYKFTPSGGSISVKVTEKIPEGSDQGEYEIRIKDSGIGMSEEFAVRVFEAFERERTSTVSGIQGTGLGMSITKSIIDLMGGTIDLVTSPGRGTEFIIRLALPLQEEIAGADEEKDKDKETEPLRNEPFDPGSMRLLLVEDMPINREIAVMQLEGFGFKVETAENGKEGFEKVASSMPGYFDAVLMDIQMPVMDGYEATRCIRGLDDEALSRIPVIAMSANAFSEDVKKALENGMNAHIAKPVDLNEMQKVLHDILGG